MNFNQQDWHDAGIKLISIDRTNPGVNDKITFIIERVDGRNSLLEFEDVYWTSMQLNFGVIAKETILTARMLNNEDSDLINLYANWKGILNGIELTPYLIELNSTGSLIKIIAKKVIIKDL